MTELATTRAVEVRGFDTIFVHVGTQRRKVGLEAQQKLEVTRSPQGLGAVAVGKICADMGLGSWMAW